MRLSLSSALPIVTLATAAVARADVLEVATDGSGDFVTIQAAVDAAVDGDVLLVHGGDYAGFEIVGEALHVAGVGASVRIDGGVTVRDLPAGETVVLSGLEIRGAKPGAGVDGHALVLASSAGAIRVQDCRVLGGAEDLADPSCPIFGPDPLLPGGHGVLVQGCDDVALVRLEATGGDGDGHSDPEDCGSFQGADAGSGLRIEDARVAVYDATLQGGEGGEGDFSGGTGGSGVWLQSGSIYASGVTAHGGDGGSSLDFICPQGPGAAGDGIHVDDGLCNVLDADLQPGEPGTSPVCGGSGWEGEPIHQVGGQVNEIPGIARGFSTGDPLPGGSVALLALSGEPGEAAFLAFGVTTVYQAVAPPVGILFVADAPFVPLGALDGAGSLLVPIAVPLLPPGVPELELVAQAGFVDAVGGARLAAPAMAAWVP